MSVMEVSLKDDDPEAYIELLQFKQPRRQHEIPARRSHKFGPKLSASFQDATLYQRFARILDIIARACLSQKGQVATAVASIKECGDTVQTTLYISYNGHAYGRPNPNIDVEKHVHDLFNALRDIPIASEVVENSPPSLPAGQPGVNAASTRFLRIMYEFGWDLWQYYIYKRMEGLEVALQVIKATQAKLKADAQEEKQKQISKVESQTESLTEQECDELSTLLHWIKGLPLLLASGGQGEKRTAPGLMAKIYRHWLAEGYIMSGEGETSSTPKMNVLDKLEAIVLDEREVYFPFQRWIAKIMSFHTHGLTFLRLAHSRRLRPILQGALRVIVLPPHDPSPSLLFTLEPDTISDVISVVRKECSSIRTSTQQSLDNPLLNEVVETFPSFVMDKFWKKHKCRDEVTHNAPYVHSELCMLEYLEEREIDFLPYFGVSKLSCVGCIRYFQAFAFVTGRTIDTRGTHGKFYPAWLMPQSPQGVREEMVRLLKQELGYFLLEYIEYEWQRKLSDSSAGSVEGASATDIDDDDGPSWGSFVDIIKTTME